MSYTINKIYHLKDLHIRNLKEKNKEYREVFNKFLKQVKQDNMKILSSILVISSC